MVMCGCVVMLCQVGVASGVSPCALMYFVVALRGLANSSDALCQ
jgi:hypothetical protein